MIAPGTLCKLQNPMSVFVGWRRFLETGCELIECNKHLFTIVSLPHRLGNEHYAYGFIDDGRLGFVNCKWLVEVREGDDGVGIE